MRLATAADGVTVLHLEGAKANAIGAEMLDRLGALVDEADSATALVVTGYDRFFSGGLDLPSLVGLDPASIFAFIQRFDEVMLRLFALPCPVVAAINGHAIAGGCVLALQCDVRLMAAGKARIGLNEAQIGIGLPVPPVETLRSQVPAASLLPIALEGRLFLPEEALSLGLIHAVVEPTALLETAIARAKTLRGAAPKAFAQIKRTLRAPVLEAARRDWDDSARAWVETWFAPEAQQLLKATVARLSARPQ